MTLPRRPLLQALAAASLSAACGPPQKPPARPQPQRIDLHLDPPSDLLPAGGLDALAVVRWSETLRALDAPLGLILPSAGLNDLGDYLGFNLRLADDLIVASYGKTTLYVLHVVHNQDEVERKFRDRLTSDVVRSVDGPGVVRVTGQLGSSPRGIATFLPDVVAYEVGPTGPLKATSAFAQNKLKRARPALSAEPLASLVPRLGNAPIRLFFPSPAASWQGAHGLLERATAAGVALTPGPQGLSLRAVLLGAWDDPPKEALRRLDLTVQDISTSSLGRLTGLNAPVASYQYDGAGEVISVDAILDPAKLAQGLRDITRSSLQELFPGALKPKP